MGRRTADGAPGARGWLLALCSAGLSIAAHQSAGGAPADLALSVLLTTMLAWGAASVGRRGGTLWLMGVLATTQAAQHVLLTEVAGGTHGQAMAEQVDGWLMLATHAVATLASAMLLTRADAALTTVGVATSWLTSRLLTVCQPPVATRLASFFVTARRPGPVLEVLLRRVSQRRGPPVRS